MESFIADQANLLHADIVDRSGVAIVSGTVIGYLKMLSGTYAGKWFRASDSSWQATESSAGAMAFADNASWEVTVAAAAWLSGSRYKFYAKESDDLNVPYSVEVLEVRAAADVALSAVIVRTS